jgi:hypothetical protein
MTLAASLAFVNATRGVAGSPFVPPSSAMDPRPHPFPGKLTLDEAEEVRRLRAHGLPLAELADKFGISKSSACRIIHLKAHAPEGALRIALPTRDLDLLRELAEDEEVPIEQLAADLLVAMLRNRAW